MRIPSQQKLDINTHKFKHQIDVLHNPLLYRDRRKRHKVTAPRDAPHFNSINKMTATEADNLRAHISMLAERGNPSFSSLTSDDLTIILNKQTNKTSTNYPPRRTKTTLLKWL